MEIAVLIEKYCDLNPALGVTSAHSNILGSLRSAGISHHIFHYDEYLINNKKAIDDYLLSEVKSIRPTILFVSYYPFEDDRNVKIETFHKIKEYVPVVFVWFDFGHQHIKGLAMKNSSASTLNVVVDVFEAGDKFIPMWVPQDETIFDKGNSKSIDVSFVGSVYEDRRRYISFLRSRTNLQVSGGQREHKLSIEEYAEMLKRSRISLNFPSKPDGTIQAKSRIYESMLCGALLLEESNSAITKWFTPMVEYVPFDNENDVLDKIKYYLRETEKRAEIVNNAYNKMKTTYNSLCWWDKVIEAAT